MKNTLLKYLPILLFFSFIIWMVVLADINQENLIMKVGNAVPGGDKIGHFSLFGILALLLNIALKFRKINIRNRSFHLGSVVVFAFATLEEFSQLGFSTRTFDVTDMLFDLFGIGVFSSVAFRRLAIRKLKSFTEYLDKILCIE